MISGLPVQRLGDVNSSGGAIVAGIPTVLVNGRPIAVLGMPVTNCGVTTATQTGVFAMNLPVTRMNDPDSCGAVRVLGSLDVFVGTPRRECNAPTISSFTPSSGPASGGTKVIIFGTNLSGTTSVTFAGIEAASFTVNSSNQITAVTASAFATSGFITVTTSCDTAISDSDYTYTE